MNGLTPDKNSYSYIMRDGLLGRLKELPMFSNVVKWSRNRMKGPVQLENIPHFGLYLIDEQSSPDGDSNAGPPHFTHLLKLGFSVVIISNDNDTAEWNLDQAYWAIMGYFQRQDWFRFHKDVDYKLNIDVEGVERVSRKHVFGNRALNNETPVAELQVEMTLKYRSYIPPYVPDDLDKIHVEVAPKWPYDPGAYVPPFTVEYDLTTIEPVPPPIEGAPAPTQRRGK